MHKITFTTDELRLIISAFNLLQIPGKDVRVVGLLYDKIATEIEKKDATTAIIENLKETQTK